MKKGLKFYATMFSATFFISAFTFGGGFVIIPLMKNKFVQDLHWIEENEMLDMAAIAQSSPGPVAVNASILIGYRLAGLGGAMVTMLGAVLPPLIILSVISMFYTAFRDSAVVASVLRGMRAGVAAVIVDVVLNMGWDVLKKRQALQTAIMFCSFLAVYLFKINVVLIILVCGGLGAASTYYAGKHGKSEADAK